jgi:hypothetical protein
MITCNIPDCDEEATFFSQEYLGGNIYFWASCELHRQPLSHGEVEISEDEYFILLVMES